MWCTIVTNCGVVPLWCGTIVVWRTIVLMGAWQKVRYARIICILHLRKMHVLLVQIRGTQMQKCVHCACMRQTLQSRVRMRAHSETPIEVLGNSNFQDPHTNAFSDCPQQDELRIKMRKKLQGAVPNKQIFGKAKKGGAASRTLQPHRGMASAAPLASTQ